MKKVYLVTRTYLTTRWKGLRWAVWALLVIGGLTAVAGLFFEKSGRLFWIGLSFLAPGGLAYLIHEHKWGRTKVALLSIFILIACFYLWNWKESWVIGIRWCFAAVILWGVLVLFDRRWVAGPVAIIVGILFLANLHFLANPSGLIRSVFNFGSDTSKSPASDVTNNPNGSGGQPGTTLPGTTTLLFPGADKILEAARLQKEAAQINLEAAKLQRETKEKEREEEEEKKSLDPNERHNRKYEAKWIE